VSLEYLTRLAAGGSLQRIRLGVEGGDFSYDFG
jgi:type VI secretion system protein VasG